MDTATAILIHSVIIGVITMVGMILLGLVFMRVGKETSGKKQLWLDCYLKYEDWGKCERIITELGRRSA
ncbi:MAG: hypothetical protein AB1485_08400 [Candidatus Thermoplasmatota archaeon]